MKELIFKEEVYAIVGAAMDVYWQLGRGFLEPVYQEALGIEFGRRGIPFEPKEEIVIYYKGASIRNMSFVISFRVISCEFVDHAIPQNHDPRIHTK